MEHYPSSLRTLLQVVHLEITSKMGLHRYMLKKSIEFNQQAKMEGEVLLKVLYWAQHWQRYSEMGPLLYCWNLVHSLDSNLPHLSKGL